MMQNCLFRYRPYNEFTLKEILHNELWFSKVNKLNDPFEFPFFFNRDYKYNDIELLHTLDKLNVREFDELMDYSLCPNKTYPKLRKFLDSWIDKLERDVRKDIINTNVCCFTKKSNNSLMWSHYADGMKGFCIAYDQQLLLDSNVVLEEIKYVELVEKARIYDCEIKKSDESNKSHYNASVIFNPAYLFKYSYFKHLNWKYEEEVRSIITRIDDKYKIGGQTIKMKEKTIKGVIIGHKMEKHNMQIIEMICKSKKIDLYIAVPDLKKFTVSYESYK